MQATSRYARYMFLGIGFVLLSLLPTLAACSTGNGTGSSGGTSTAQSTAGKSVTGVATSSVTAGVLLGVQPCPGATRDPSYWNPFILPQSGSYKVESVSCANIMDAPALQALVTVRHSDAGSSLDVYVFSNITATTPTRIFLIMGLVKGDAKISGYNTVLTAQADELSALNKGKLVSAMTADLFREFDWSAPAGKLIQVAFPGIFPDLTRYQAEADQAQVNQGHQPWKLSATMVANALAASLLNWPTNSSTTLLSGGGAHDVSAVVLIKSSYVVSGHIKVTLSRLEGNTQNGIWEAIAVESDDASITSPLPLTIINNPVSVKGTGNAFEGTIGQVIVLDHLYHPLGQATATGATGNGQTTFSTGVSYQSTFPAGTQEGVLFLSIPSNANGSIATAVMEKVLIPGLPQGR